jgi:hypothetical protein
VDLGVVLTKPCGPKGIDMGVRYCVGLTEVFKDNATGISSTNRAFELLLSFPFVNVVEAAANGPFSLSRSSAGVVDHIP